ncbi:hypothetical protein [Flavobacterium sp.]|uniref:hypothetical protein n=1 Tax=Flavobacterium sp. TaxID=239 RepID=UPI0039E45C81
MKIRLFLLLFFGALATHAQQKITLTASGTEMLQADAFVGYDNFGASYFIKDNVFCKKNANRILEYKNLAFGKIKLADIKNPLQMVLFYENFNTAVLLDNQLNETQKINFSQNTVPIVALTTGMASQNRLWIYNSLSQKVGLYDYLRNDYREITVPLSVKPIHFKTDFNYFYWIDEKGQRYACDIYGKITAYGTFTAFDDFAIANDRWILYTRADKLYAFEAKTDKTYPLDIAEKTFKSFQYQAQILSIFTTEGISNYKITLP